MMSAHSMIGGNLFNDAIGIATGYIYIFVTEEKGLDLQDIPALIKQLVENLKAYAEGKGISQINVNVNFSENNGAQTNQDAR